MKWFKRQLYLESDDKRYQIWHCGKRWILMQSQPYYNFCEMCIDDVYRVLGRFSTLNQAKIFVEWYDKEGELK